MMTLLLRIQRAQDRIKGRYSFDWGEDDCAGAVCFRERGWTPEPRRGGVAGGERPWGPWAIKTAL